MSLASTSRAAHHLYPGSSSVLVRQLSLPCLLSQTRNVSSSPYGRTHVWKRRAPKLPNPVAPLFPQRVVRSDGSTFMHWTTSPRSVIRLTRDVTNHPLWNPSQLTGRPGFEDDEEEGKAAGRMGRFSRRFGDGLTVGQDNDVSWMEEFADDGASLPLDPVKAKPDFKKK